MSRRSLEPLEGRRLLSVSTLPISVAYGKIRIASGQAAAVHLGMAFVGHQAKVTFSVTNGSRSAVTLGTTTVPDGFTVFQALPATLAPGAEADLVLEASATTVGAESGTVAIPISAAGAGNTFEFPLDASVGNCVAFGGAVTKVMIGDGRQTFASLSLKGKGSGQITWADDDAWATTSKGVTKITVAPTDGSPVVDIAGIALSGTDATSSLSSTRSGPSKSQVILTSLADDSYIKSVSLANFLLGSNDGRHAAEVALPEGAETFVSGAIGDTTTFVSGGISKLSLGPMDGGTIRVNGNIGQLTFAQAQGIGSIAASGSIGSITVTHGSLANGSISAGGSIGSIRALFLYFATISSGVLTTDGPPATSADFASASSIGQIVLTCPAKSYQEGLFASSIFAAKIGSLNLSAASPDAYQGIIVAESISSLQAKGAAGKAFSARGITSAMPIAQMLITSGIPTSALSVTLV